ncbi:MAG TPA: hypothetical protein PK228_05265 [Saprospiraceae bacterium]|nr:hypothetical protein [Saprospiraceae bacterium]
MKYYRTISMLLLLFFALAAAPACKTKSGCEATESLKPKAGKDGSYKSSKKRDDGLFPKKMAKKMK